MKRIVLVLAGLGIAALVAVDLCQAAGPRIRFPRRQQMQNAAANQSVDYEFSVLDAAKVRLLNPPVQFDDKGHPKKFTSEEMKKLKGDDPAEQKLSGIKSSFDVLKPGDIVQVTFSRPKNPKDLEKTTWSTLAGSMVGIVANVESGKLTIRVSPMGPPQAGQGGDRMALLRRDAPKNVIKAEQRQASVIVIMDQAPEQQAKPGRMKRKKKNDN